MAKDQSRTGTDKKCKTHQQAVFLTGTTEFPFFFKSLFSIIAEGHQTSSSAWLSSEPLDLLYSWTFHYHQLLGLLCLSGMRNSSWGLFISGFCMVQNRKRSWENVKAPAYGLYPLWFLSEAKALGKRHTISKLHVFHTNTKPYILWLLEKRLSAAVIFKMELRNFSTYLLSLESDECMQNVANNSSHF